MAEMLKKTDDNFVSFFCQLANLNASLYGDETRQERCLCSRLEVHEVARRSLQPLLSRRTSARDSGRTGARIQLKIVEPLGTDRPHRSTEYEVNRPSRFNLSSKKRSPTRPRFVFPYIPALHTSSHYAVADHWGKLNKLSTEKGGILFYRSIFNFVLRC